MDREKKMNLNETTNSETAVNREGFAMVTTLLVVLILSVLAVGVAWIASSEKKTSFAEGVHVRSVFAADAGGEAAINFIRMSEVPPPVLNFVNNTVRDQGSTVLQGSETYDFNARFLQKRVKPGWGTEYLDYDYRVASHGTASRLGQSGVVLVVSRLYREGY
jgi:hypothetical protein